MELSGISSLNILSKAQSGDETCAVFPETEEGQQLNFLSILQLLMSCKTQSGTRTVSCTEDNAQTELPESEGVITVKKKSENGGVVLDCSSENTDDDDTEPNSALAFMAANQIGFFLNNVDYNNSTVKKSAGTETSSADTTASIDSCEGVVNSVSFDSGGDENTSGNVLKTVSLAEYADRNAMSSQASGYRNMGETSQTTQTETAWQNTGQNTRVYSSGVNEEVNPHSYELDGLDAISDEELRTDIAGAFVSSYSKPDEASGEIVKKSIQENLAYFKKTSSGAASVPDIKRAESSSDDGASLSENESSLREGNETGASSRQINTFLDKIKVATTEKNILGDEDTASEGDVIQGNDVKVKSASDANVSLMSGVVVSENGKIPDEENAAYSSEASPSEQITLKVRDALKQNVSTFKMKLEPEDLGGVTVHMTLTNGKFGLRISTELSSTRALLESRISDLRSSLEENSDFNVLNVDVSSGSDTNTGFSFGGYLYENAQQNSSRYVGDSSQSYDLSDYVNDDGSSLSKTAVYSNSRLNYTV